MSNASPEPRGDRIERQALQAWHAAVASTLPESGWRLERVGDALCSICAREPSILLNRVLGLGSEATPSEAQLTAIRRLYERAGIERFFLHVGQGLQHPATRELLGAAGYRKYRGWMKFRRGPLPPGRVRSRLSVEAVGAERADQFAAIAAPAFGLRAQSQPMLAALARAEGWQLFMSLRKGEPAGTGALFLNDGLGYTDWGATSEDHRRQGSQGVLFAARLQAAIDAGCDTVFTMTGEEVPGEAQVSYRNIQRAGFTEAGLRENWIPA